MDSTNSIWTFINWGRPFRLSTQRLSSNPDSIPIQVECGWMFSSALTKSGDVFVWWPFSGQMDTVIQNKMTSMDQEGPGDKQKAKAGVIRCACWDLEMDPYLLPPLPSLPDLSASDDAGAFKDNQIIQIAGFDNRLIALTNHGHVLMFGSLDNESTAPAGSWQYVGGGSLHRSFQLPDIHPLSFRTLVKSTGSKHIPHLQTGRLRPPKR
jgi:SCF-associated factor 1